MAAKERMEQQPQGGSEWHEQCQAKHHARVVKATQDQAEEGDEAVTQVALKQASWRSERGRFFENEAVNLQPKKGPL